MSLIRSLHVAAAGDVLGAFQGHAAVRRITQGDHAVLAAYARLRYQPSPCNIRLRDL